MTTKDKTQAPGAVRPYDNNPGGHDGPLEGEYGLTCYSDGGRCKHLGINDFHYPYCSAQSRDGDPSQPVSESYPWPGAGRHIFRSKPNAGCPYTLKETTVITDQEEAICNGSIALGTACGKCAKCRKEIEERLNVSGAVRSLGQIAYEAMTAELIRRHGFANAHPQFNVLHQDGKYGWESVARAVADECAKIAEQQSEFGLVFYHDGADIAAEIRARAGLPVAVANEDKSNA